MASYYNENDPKSAAWLRELIKEKLIADGEVDERSIKEVTPKDVEGFDQCHWFAGIGGWSLALRLAGWPDNRPVWTGSCPCQPFSVAGKGKAQKDPRHLWPWFRHLIFRCRPPIAFGEQVASADGRIWLAGIRANLETLGYATGAADLCAAGIGAPHIRQRVYWVAHSQGEQFQRSGQSGVRDAEDEDSKKNCCTSLIGICGTGRMANSNGWNQGDGDIQRSGKHRLQQEMFAIIPTGWATPNARDWKSEIPPEKWQREGQGQPLSRQVLGTITSSSPAVTEKRGALNPDLSRWLMGYPDEWRCCGVTAMQLSRKSQRNSSKQG